MQIHSLRREEVEEALREARRRGPCRYPRDRNLGRPFRAGGQTPRWERIRAQLDPLADAQLGEFLLYKVLVEARPDLVIDCVNTATGIAYRDVFRAADAISREIDAGEPTRAAAEDLLEALYMPRLIRHVQVLYRGMTDAGVGVYIKVGTSGTGGMGLNIPYTHSEERPSRVLLAKSTIAGAHSMLLFLMARTPGAPITKEIKPAAAITWKRIAHGPVVRRGETLRWVEARPRPARRDLLHPRPGRRPPARPTARERLHRHRRERHLSLEEFAALTTAEQMEFVTPEEEEEIAGP